MENQGNWLSPSVKALESGSRPGPNEQGEVKGTRDLGGCGVPMMGVLESKSQKDWSYDIQRLEEKEAPAPDETENMNGTLLWLFLHPVPLQTGLCLPESSPLSSPTDT